MRKKRERERSFEKSSQRKELKNNFSWWDICKYTNSFCAHKFYIVRGIQKMTNRVQELTVQKPEVLSTRKKQPFILWKSRIISYLWLQTQTANTMLNLQVIYKWYWFLTYGPLHFQQMWIIESPIITLS